MRPPEKERERESEREREYVAQQVKHIPQAGSLKTKIEVEIDGPHH